MNEQEALKYLKAFRECYDRDSNTPNAKALDIAINTLEKTLERTSNNIDVDVTSLYGTMIEAFSADFQLAKRGEEKLNMLNRMIENKDKRLTHDIDLLYHLDCGLRYGLLKIIEVNEHEKINSKN